MKEENFLTISQAAKILNVHPDTLRRWERSGKINSVRIGTRRDRRYKSEDIYSIIDIQEGHDIEVSQHANVMNFSKVTRTRELIEAAKGILFDLGDTLMSVFPSRGYLFSEIASKYGYNLKPSVLEQNWQMLYAEWEQERLISEVLLRSDEREYEALYSRLNANALIKSGLPVSDRSKALEAGREIYLTVLSEPKYWHVMPNVIPFVKKLIKEEKKIAIVSNWNSSMESFVKSSLLGKYFKYVFSGTKLYFKKPDPEIFLHATSKMDLNVEDVVHIGNSFVDDVIGATNAGIQPILFDNERDHYFKDVPAFYQYSDLL